MRKNLRSDIHTGILFFFGENLAFFNTLKYGIQLIAHKDGDNRRRCLVGSQSVIVSGGCNGYSHQILMIIHSRDNRHQKYQERKVLGRILARIQQVHAGIGADGPVVVLAAAVNAFERFLRKQAGKAVLVSNLLHHLHRQLVVVDSHIGCLINRSQLVLGRSNLIMLGLGRNAELPQFLVQVMHVFGNSWFQNSEIMIFHLLPLRSRSADQRASADQKVFSLQVQLLVNQEIFLFRTYRCAYMGNGCIAEQAEDSQRRAVQFLHGTKQRCLLIQRLAAVRAECGGNVKCSIFNKGR